MLGLRLVCFNEESPLYKLMRCRQELQALTGDGTLERCDAGAPGGAYHLIRVPVRGVRKLTLSCFFVSDTMGGTLTLETRRGRSWRGRTRRGHQCAAPG